MNNNDYTSKINNIMDKAKEDVRTQIDRAYQQGYADAKSELGQNAIDLAHAESDRAYQQGLEDAWEFIQKLLKDECDGGYTVSLLQNALGYCNIRNIVLNYGINEAIAKIKEYEEKQKQATEIKVGDEVVMDDKGRKAVVSRVLDDAYNIVFYNGDTNCVDRCFIAKTGRHFDAIAEVLAEMRGE